MSTKHTLTACIIQAYDDSKQRLVVIDADTCTIRWKERADGTHLVLDIPPGVGHIHEYVEAGAAAQEVEARIHALPIVMNVPRGTTFVDALMDLLSQGTQEGDTQPFHVPDTLEHEAPSAVCMHCGDTGIAGIQYGKEIPCTACDVYSSVHVLPAQHVDKPVENDQPSGEHRRATEGDTP